MPRSPFASPLVWVLFAAIILVAVARSFLDESGAPPRLPDLGQVPPFRLSTPERAAFGSEDLRGTVYVASFFFTRCPSICSVLMNAMAQLQQRLKGVEGVRLVSVTVDPANDTPESLAEYAETLGVDAARWTLLTGERERIRELLVAGFRVAMGEEEVVGENLIDIAHSGKLVLVDQKGRIRGFYDYNQAGVNAVFRDSRSLATTAP